MRENIKVIYDTNSIRAEMSASTFFGWRSELEKFAAVAEIVIPDMVIDEIKAQKRAHFVVKRDQFVDNPFHEIKKIDPKETRSFDIEKFISELHENETISHRIIYLTKPDALAKIRELCHARRAPFGDTGDKGFKDAYIYLTLLEYMEGITDERVFFVTKDEKLKDAIRNVRGVILVEDFEEFEKFNISSFQDEYFVSKLVEEVSDQITTESIVSVQANVDGNWILNIKENDFVTHVLVDFLSREIISFTNDFNKYLNLLCDSGSYQATHDTISEMEPYRIFFSDQDILKLLRASLSNGQIFQIAKDQDVRAFFVDLYSIRKQLLSAEEQEEFEVRFMK